MKIKTQSFVDLQNLWQNQYLKEPFIKESELQDTNLIKRLKTFEKEQLRINLGKTVALFIIVSSFTLILFRFKSPSPMLLISLFWIVACLVTFMIYYWKKQFRASQLDFSLRTNQFINSTIEGLNNQKRSFKTYFPMLVLGMLIGINIFYIDALSDLNLHTRILYHIAGSIFIALFIPIGQKIRNWKFSREQQPVINDLIDFKNEIKE